MVLFYLCLIIDLCCMCICLYVYADMHMHKCGGQGCCFSGTHYFLRQGLSLAWPCLGSVIVSKLQRAPHFYLHTKERQVLCHHNQVMLTHVLCMKLSFAPLCGKHCVYNLSPQSPLHCFSLNLRKGSRVLL